MIRGIIIEPNEAPREITFEEGYKTLQELVGGYIEMPYFYDDVDVVINEEGKLIGLEPNLPVYYNGDLIDVIYGTAIIISHNDEGDTVSLTDTLFKKYMDELQDGCIYIWR